MKNPPDCLFSHYPTLFENDRQCRILNLRILAFFTNFCLIKSDLSGNTVWPQASGFRKLAKLTNFWLTFVHSNSKCKRCSLRSQCWVRLFCGLQSLCGLFIKWKILLKWEPDGGFPTLGDGAIQSYFEWKTCHQIFIHVFLICITHGWKMFVNYYKSSFA